MSGVFFCQIIEFLRYFLIFGATFLSTLRLHLFWDSVSYQWTLLLFFQISLRFKIISDMPGRGTTFYHIDPRIQSRRAEQQTTKNCVASSEFGQLAWDCMCKSSAASSEQGLSRVFFDVTDVYQKPKTIPLNSISGIFEPGLLRRSLIWLGG